MPAPYDRLKKAREKRFSSASEAARALNVPTGTYISNENGSRPFGKKRAETFAAAFGVNLEWLLTGRGEMEARRGNGASLDVPLISWVSAGPLVIVDAVEQYADAKRVTGPDLDAGGDWIALTVEGDSMDRISPPESTIFVNRKDRRLVPNACYVIADEHGGATYKRWRPDDGWSPVSTNEDHKPLRMRSGADVTIIGRVRLSLLKM